MKEIKTLSYKIGTILLNNIFDILKKTKDHEENFLHASGCRSGGADIV